MPLPLAQLSIHPEKGRFSFTSGVPIGNLAVCYNFGLLSEIGAGGYNTAILSSLPLPDSTVSIANGISLNSALAAVARDVNIEITDSLTYAGPTNRSPCPTAQLVAVTAMSGQRPVVRFAGGAPTTWTITGNAAASGAPTVLVLEGLLVQGANIVLQGGFDSVYLRMMTLDPGTIGVAPPNPPPFFSTAIDGMPLTPTTLFIEGSITNLVIERSICGPIRTANGGAIQNLTATDSIIQSIPTHLVPSTGTLTRPDDLRPCKPCRLRSNSE